MIDYVKIFIVGVDVQRLISLPILEFTGTFSESTGVVDSRLIAVYHFCKITVYENGLIQLSGSLHKLWNSLNGVLAPNFTNIESYKGFNGNTFEYKHLNQVREHLMDLFDCSADAMSIVNIEFGFNTNPKFNPQLFLKGLLFHGGKSFEYKHKEHFAQVIHQRYYLKIYNKSNQYKMKDYTLRVELKYRKAQGLKEFGITTLNDLSIETLERAYKMILKRFDEVVYYDYTIDRSKLTKRQHTTLDNYSNPRYWLIDLSPNRRDKPKRKLKNFINQYSKNLHLKIRQDLNVKASQILMFLSANKGVIINSTFDDEKRVEIPPEKSKKCQLMQKPKSVIINSSNIGLIITPLPLQQPYRFEAKKQSVKTGDSESGYFDGKTNPKLRTKKEVEKDQSEMKNMCVCK